MGAGEATEPLLRRLFRAAGYRLEDRAAGLWAYRLRDRRAVVVVNGLRSPSDLQSEFPPDSLHRTVIYSEDPGASARDLASAHGLEVLDPTTLGPALGELLLPPLAEEPAAPPALETPSSVFPERARSVQPRLGRSDAEVIAGVDGFRSTLRLVPYFVAPYRVRSPSVAGAAGPASDHLVAVNAITGQVDSWEPGERELGEEPTEAEERLAPRFSEASCKVRAERELRARHTIMVDHTEQHGGTIVIERRRVAPGPADLRIGTGVFLQVPFWYVEGREGRFVIDAVTGVRSVSMRDDDPLLEGDRTPPPR